MNPENLTTHALGEPLPPADQAAIEQALASDAQTRADFEATQAFTQFLQQNLATDHPEATLTDEQKQRLLDSRGASGSLAPKSKTRWLTRAILPLSAAALISLTFKQWNHETQTPPAFTTQTEVKDIAGREMTPVPPATSSPAPQDPAASTEAFSNILRKDPVNTAARGDMDRAETPISTPAAAAKPSEQPGKANFMAFRDQRQTTESKEIPAQTSGTASLEKTSAGTLVLEGTSTRTGAAQIAGGTMPLGGSIAPKKSLAHAPASPSSPPPSDPFSAAPTAADGDLSEPATRRQNTPFPGDRPVNGVLIRPDSTPAAAPIPQSVSVLGNTQTTRDSVIRRELPIAPTTESYTPIQEPPLTAVLREPLSTFSIDVDTASYANTRRFLNRSSLPPRDAVRIEELVNYFPYNLEGPPPGSPHPFAVHVEVADCPWQPQHRLARIGIQGKKVGLEQRNSNFVFLIDVSGSMNQPDKLPLVKESLRLLVEQLTEKDRVSIVTYAGSSGLVLPPTNGDQKDRILAAINNMNAGGSTHGSAGIQLAYEQAIAGFIPEGVNRVILCSDGDFNVGVSSPQELEKLITEKARSGVFLSVLGFGTGNLKDRAMETLADKGNGNYGYIDSLSEARKVLVEQMTGTLITIAKDVKIQVEFNPAQVASYRLIGYENRLLAKEDFNDDTKDAGEIGAGHSVTALYEIVPAGLTPPAAPVDPLKYQTPAAAPAPVTKSDTPSSPELLTVKLRYKAPEGATSQLIEVPVTDKETSLAAASPEFKFTTAVAAYGLMLRQSSFRGNLTWDQIRNLALEGKSPDPHGYRAEFLQLLDKARGLLPDRQ